MLRATSEKPSERTTGKALRCVLTSILMMPLILPVFAADKQKDEDTLRRANLVLQDMLNSNNISPTLLSKADCLLILPGMKKFGFGVGGSGGPRSLALQQCPKLRRQVVRACDVFSRRCQHWRAGRWFVQ